MRKVLTVVALLVVVAGCESDAAKLKRLELDEIMAESAVRGWESALEITGPGRSWAWANETNPGGRPKFHTTEAIARDSLSLARQRHTLAQRELEQFKAGR